MLTFTTPIGRLDKANEALNVTKDAHLDQVNARARLYLSQYLGRSRMLEIWGQGQRIYNLQERSLFYAQAVLACEEALVQASN